MVSHQTYLRQQLNTEGQFRQVFDNKIKGAIFTQFSDIILPFVKVVKIPFSF